MVYLRPYWATSSLITDKWSRLFSYKISAATNVKEIKRLYDIVEHSDIARNIEEHEIIYLRNRWLQLCKKDKNPFERHVSLHKRE